MLRQNKVSKIEFENVNTRLNSISDEIQQLKSNSNQSQTGHDDLHSNFQNNSTLALGKFFLDSSKKNNNFHFTIFEFIFYI